MSEHKENKENKLPKPGPVRVSDALHRAMLGIQAAAMLRGEKPPSFADILDAYTAELIGARDTPLTVRHDALPQDPEGVVYQLLEAYYSPESELHSPLKQALNILREKKAEATRASKTSPTHIATRPKKQASG